MEEVQMEMRARIQEGSRSMKDPAGRDVRILRDQDSLQIAAELGRPLREVYMAALALGICPYRYLRNRETISLAEQLELAKAQVGLVGAGGLGGHIILLLARVGIGRLVVVDHDVFDETNLNRQALSTREALGKPKANEAATAAAAVNPGVEVTAHRDKMNASTARDILSGSSVIVDALDNIQDRLVLEEAAKGLGVPLVHGALAGFQGQVMTIYPEDAGLGQIYGKLANAQEGFKTPEAILGVPALTPSLVATFQAMEVIKIILGRGNVLRNKMAYLDLEGGEVRLLTFPTGASRTGGPGDDRRP